MLTFNFLISAAHGDGSRAHANSRGHGSRSYVESSPVTSTGPDPTGNNASKDGRARGCTTIQYGVHASQSKKLCPGQLPRF